MNQDKWKTLVHTASIAPQQRRGAPVPQELLDRVLAAQAYWSEQQAKLHGDPPVPEICPTWSWWRRQEWPSCTNRCKNCSEGIGWLTFDWNLSTVENSQLGPSYCWFVNRRRRKKKKKKLICKFQQSLLSLQKCQSFWTSWAGFCICLDVILAEPLWWWGEAQAHETRWALSSWEADLGCYGCCCLYLPAWPSYPTATNTNRPAAVRPDVSTSMEADELHV